MNLFIDTNVFLTFYHLSNDDIEELKKLVALVAQKRINLILPEQVCEEFHRNREVKIKDALKSFSDKQFGIPFPVFCKAYQTHDELKELLKKANKAHADLVAQVTKDASDGKLNADEVINQLFEKATKIEFSLDLFNKAVMRYRLGNPPGKNPKSLGDELNWETILSSAPSGEDLHFVSTDKDYVSSLDPKSFHPYLMREWKSAKSSEIIFYTNLSDYFKSNFPEIELASDVERVIAIQKLAQSGSFLKTHVAIAELEKFNDFTVEEVEQLVSIYEKNSQINYIIGDKDVLTFYRRIIDSYGEKIEAEKLKRLISEVEEYEASWRKREEAEAALSEPGDDIPF